MCGSGWCEASEGRIGSPTDAALLFCYHYDPLTGKYGLVVANVMRIAGAVTLLVLGIFLFLMFRQEKYGLVSSQVLPPAATHDASSAGRAGMEGVAAMMQGIPIHPEQASTIAREVDLLHYVLTAITLFFTVVIFLIIFYFMIRYRRRSPDERPQPIEGSVPLEVAWTLIPTLICVVIFLWGSSLVLRERQGSRRRDGDFCHRQAVDVEGAASGRNARDQRIARAAGPPREADDDLRGRDPRFFRPGVPHQERRSARPLHLLWFTATETGKFHLFCAQYCGAFHAGMGGWVIVMEQSEYDRWLNGEAPGTDDGSGGRGPFPGTRLRELPRRGRHRPRAFAGGRLRNSVRLASGAAATANEAYLREAILTPSAISVPGYTHHHAVVSGTAHRRADPRPDRLHPFAQRRRKAMSATTTTAPSLPPPREPASII